MNDYPPNVQPSAVNNTGKDWHLLPEFFLRSAGFPLALLDGLRCLKTLEALEAKSDTAEDVLIHERTRVAAHLLTLFEREDVAQAIYVSSPEAYRNALRKACEALKENRTDSNSRRAIRVAFSYLQRFAAKNETTSFFGPMNYGRVRHDLENTLVYSETAAAQDSLGGAKLATERRVFLTYWAMCALSRCISQAPDVAAVLPLRAHPLLTRESGYFGIRRERMILENAGVTAILDRVDEKRSLAEVAEPFGVKGEALLAKLLKADVLVRGLNVPSSELDMLGRVTDQLAQLPKSGDRDLWLARLAGWSTWCTDMSGAGFAARRDLLGEAEASFTDQTKEQARRGAGQLYEDRAIYYEETRGSVNQFDIGPDLHKTLITRIAPILDLAAEQGHHEWMLLQAVAREKLDELEPKTGTVNFARFVEAMRDQTPPYVAKPTPCATTQRLTKLVGEAATSGTTAVHIDPLKLNPTKRETLEQSNAASYALADLFLDAPSPQHVARGDFQILVRKLHHALPIPGWLGTMHPDPDRFENDMAQLLRQPGFDRLIALEVQRRNKGFYNFPGRRVVYSEPVLNTDLETISAAKLEIRRRGTNGVALYIRGETEPVALYLTLSDHQRFAPFAALTVPWMALPIVSLGAFTPRIVIEGAVLQRATWLCTAGDVQAACKHRGVKRLQAMRHWHQNLGMPERVFVATPQDRKPVFVDLANEVSLDILAAMARGADELLVQEMFPDRDGLFLHPHIGGCTSELRIGIANGNMEGVST